MNLNKREIRKKIREKQQKNSVDGNFLSLFASSRFILSMAISTVSLLVFFWLSPMLFGAHEERKDSGTGVDSEQRMNEQMVCILYRSQPESEDYFETILQVSDTNVTIDRHYETVALETKTNQRYQTKLTYLYGDHYLIQVLNLPANWEELVLAFGYEETVNDTLKTHEVNFNFLRSKVPKDPKTKPLSPKNYISLMSDIEAKAVKKRISEAKKRIQEHEKMVHELQEKIQQNTLDMAYQSGKEKEATQNAISRLEAKISDTASKIKEERSIIEEARSHLTKIKERKESVQEKDKQ